MQTDTIAQDARLTELTNADLAAAHTEAIDLGNAADTVAYFVLRDLAATIRRVLSDRGVQPCGNCPEAKPGAVDWGCTCSMAPEERNAEAVAFARMHD